MEIKRLHHFLAVIDAGSITEAARKLHMSQGALSLSIQALERELGSPLFGRSLEGMAPNEIGRALEARALSIANELGRANREVRELLGMERGRVVIGTAVHFTDEVLPRAMLRFHADHPGVEIGIVVDFNAGLVRAIKTGAIDFAVTSLSRHVTADPELDHRIFFPRVETRVTAAATNPLTARRRVSLEELIECPWLMPSRTDFYRSAIEETFVGLGVPAPKVAAEYASVAMAKRLLCEGPYIGFFSKFVMREELDSGRLKFIAAPQLRLKSPNATGAFYRRNVGLTPAAQNLVDIIKEISCDRVR